MRITSIELAGSIEIGKKLPRAFAKIARTTDSDYIEVTIICPGGESTRLVRADCEEDLRSMAECLLHELEGLDGPDSAINDYYRELHRFAD